MTEMFEEAVAVLRQQPPEIQDRAAEAMLVMVDEGREAVFEFDEDELKALCREGLDSGPGGFADIEEIKREARRRLENAASTRQ